MQSRKLKVDLGVATAGQMLEKLASLTVLMVLTRYVPVERLGEYFFAVSLAGLCGMLTRDGTITMLNRSVAQTPVRAPDFLGLVLSVRLPLTLGTFILLNAATAAVSPKLLVVMIPASWPFLLLAALRVANFRLDTVMVYSLRSPSEAASYETAFKLLEVSRLLIRPAAMVFFPLIAAMAAQAAWAKLRHTANNLVAATAVSGAVLGAAVAAVAPWVMPTIWGPEYAGSGGVLRVLYISVPLLWIGLVGTLLAQALGREKQAAIGMGLSLLVNLGMNAAVVPTWGAVGAAWTTLATQGSLSVWLLLLVHRALADAAAPMAERDAPDRTDAPHGEAVGDGWPAPRSEP